ncbi:hypothetical protein Aple_071590 [Acrocarpospora pleiomorpha]|uniref:Uncharacterized protein n=1 Tax=Acrocarpospora pleiomorpha TaxID=90975 RepID=A0A5M3XTQ0_9ACTN|nr:hypothetical protein [Acrocarpospora pleiomorpha]GES24260.1 hypothetical protein Aple_071590 [Acrocarpospora pleiomorpha]
MTTAWERVVARLDENAVPWRKVPLGEAALIVSERGGRVYGPFWPDGSCSNWLPETFDSAERFHELLNSGAWNLGGHRMWIGAEADYIIEDGTDYWGTFVVPPSMDPGEHRLEADPGPVVLHNTVRLRNHRTNGNPFALRTQTTISPLPPPIPHEQLRDVRVAGYCQEVRTSHENAGERPEIWLLDQVPGGGKALIPATPGLRITDYYEPAGSFVERFPRGGARITLTGQNRFKLGFDALHHFARIGWWRDLPGGEAILLIRHHPSDPSAEYRESPDFAPDHRGDSLHVYNDDGDLGGFAEIETRGVPREAATANDRFHSWWFRGPTDQVRNIANDLLGLAAS